MNNNLLKGFKSLTAEQCEGNRIYLSFSRPYFRLSFAAYNAIGNPENIEILIDEENKMVAVRPSDEDNGIHIIGSKNKTQPGTTRRQIIEAVYNMIEDDSFRAIGKFFEEEKTLVFDLSKRCKLKERRTKVEGKLKKRA